MNGSASCPGKVDVRVYITHFKLSEEEINKIALSVKWLKEGKKKQIQYYYDVREGVKDEKVVIGL